MAMARTPGECARCGGSIAVGTRYFWSNLQKRRYHMPGDCAAVTGATPPDVPSEPETIEPETTPESAPTAPGDLAATIAAAVQAHLKTPAPSLDVVAVERIAARIAERIISERVSTPVVVEVRRPDGTVATIADGHYLMPRLLRLMGAGIHCYLWGPAGSGKTTAASQAATALRGDDGGEIDTLDPSTPKSAVMGYRTPMGEPVHTAFSRCWSVGRVYIADECDNAPAHVQTLYNSALANGHAPLAWGSVARAEGFGFVGTGNTPGRPTPAFPDRRPMSAAFADRMYFMHWPLDSAIECRAGGITAPPAPRRVESTMSPAAWVTWVRKVREWSAANAPTLMVTPRASLIGLQALAVGETPLETAHGLIFRGADDAMVAKVLHAVPLS